MSRRSLLVLLATLALLYSCIIVLVLAPLQQGGGRGPAARAGSPAWCRGLRWQPAAGRDPVALASFPGSGNTWLRYLLQQATGVATGSVYLDYSLRAHGFPAENVSDASVLVVKTHEPPPAPAAAAPARHYRAAVLLLRDPAHAILADFNRLHKGHVGTAPRSAFTATHLKLNWARHVEAAARGWRRFHAAWLRDFPRALHVLRYERLVLDPRASLRALLAFLNHTVSEEAMECAMANKEGIYRRRRRLRDFDPYTAAQAAAVARARRAVRALLERPPPGAQARAGDLAPDS